MSRRVFAWIAFWLAVACAPQSGAPAPPAATRPPAPALVASSQTPADAGTSGDTAWNRHIADVLRSNTSEAFNHGATAAGVAIVDGERTATVFLGSISADVQTPFGASTRFEIGSVSKVFTGLLLADAVVRREVVLSDPVNRFLGDDLVVAAQGGAPISLLDAATHAVDYPFMPTNWTPAGPDKKAYSRDEFRDFLAHRVSAERPGEAYHYGNVGPVLVAHALSAALHTPYRQLLEQRIFQPLHMAQSDFADVPAQNDNLLHGYLGPGEPALMRTHDTSVLAPCCVVRTTLDDMATFARAAMDPASPLARAFDVLGEPRHRVDALGSTWSTLGWLWLPRQKELRKNGLINGKLAALFVIPARHQGLFVIVNTEHAQIDEIATRIGDAVFGQTLAIEPGAHARSVIAALPQSATEHGVVFDDGIRLEGWSAPPSVRAGDLARITLYFRVAARPAHDFELFVHGDATKNIADRLHADHFPSGGEDSTLEWKPGEIIADTFEIAIPPSYRFKRFRVWFGLYASQRLHVVSGDSDGHDRVQGPEIAVMPK